MFFVMINVLWIASMIAGFIFPMFLIRAIRSTDEENDVPKYTLLSCVSFGVIVLTVIWLVSYR